MHTSIVRTLNSRFFAYYPVNLKPLSQVPSKSSAQAIFHHNFHRKKCVLLTRGMACVRKYFERKISKPTKLDCKQNFYCTVYYITLNSNCEAQRASKNLKKIVEDRVGSQK